jgi:hypothetical protein
MRGTARDGVVLRIDRGVLHVRITGDPPPNWLVDCFREAFDTGVLHERLPVLVDITGFRGRIDWSSIRRIGELTPWRADGGGSRVAYLSDSPWFGALLKVTAQIYPRTAHRHFDDAVPALAWLRADRP